MEVLDLVPGRRQMGKMHDFQAYLKLKKEELQPIIAERYATHKETCLEEDEKPMPFIKFQTKVAQELFAAECQEVKDEVEAFKELKSREARDSTEEITEYVSIISLTAIIYSKLTGDCKSTR